MPTRSPVSALVMGAVLFCASAAGATVVGGALTGGTTIADGGVFEKLTTLPARVGDDNQQSFNAFAFDEDQNIRIGAELAVDIGTNPVAGDIVASHYVFFDPEPFRTAIGYVDFDADIYGIVASSANLAASDFLVAGEVEYLNVGSRGLEIEDSVAIDPLNPRRMLFELWAVTPGDYVRVLTRRSSLAVPMSVPEPGSLGLLGVALAGLAVCSRRSAARRQ